MNKSKTPLTDASLLSISQEETVEWTVDAEFARSLEIKLNEANEKISLLQFLVKADTIALEKIRDEIGVENLRDVYLGNIPSSAANPRKPKHCEAQRRWASPTRSSWRTAGIARGH